MYQSKLGLSATGTQGHSNHWIDWKMALTFFALLNSPFPTETELAALRVKLTDAGTEQHVTKEQFIKVDCWFDCYEGQPDAALLASWGAEKAARAEQSEYESSDEEADEPTSDGLSK